MQESLEASLVRIHTPDGGVVGAGFLVGERHILTCAHVVAGALGLADDAQEKPQAPVSLDVPRVAPGQLLTARVVLWRPQLPDGGDDIAGLELESDPPHGAQAAPLAQVEDLWEHSFRAFGFPRGQDTGVWSTGRLLGRQLTNWVQIEDVKEPGFAVEPGFSGTPVWDPQIEAVVGMVVAAERRTNLKTAFAIPVDVLARSWPLLESLIHPFVFLCYARADSELVTRLKTDLLSQGIHVWIDREGLQPGTLDWEEALRTTIRAARAALLIASPNARSSRYVRDELRIAEMYQRPVYPLWIAGTQWMDAVPLGWGGTQYIDARESRYETAMPELVELLNKASSTPAKVPELDFEPRNPYKGLRAFTGDDAHDFFGRDTLINELAASLEEALASEEKHQQCARLLAVVGPSGSGKSSVVMAGLLPRLREGSLPGSEQWVYLDPIVPGSRPIEVLTLVLSEHLPDKSLKAIREDLEDDSTRGLHLLATKLAKRQGTKVVLLVDQFEELFTQTPSEDERRHFLDLLVTATTEPHGPIIVLLTLRADFYDRPMRYPALGQPIDRHHQLVFPMKLDELRATIEQPVALPDVRLTFEGDMVGDLLFEVQGQVGALPLLQFTLDQLYQRRSGSQLILSAYRELGGVKGALTRQAEETYAALPSEEHRKLARALFMRLIDPGASEQDTTRRRAALSEFALPEAIQTRQLQEVIDDFIAARLLTTNEIAGTTTIEVSHEALIREWPRLAGWLREAREDIRLQQTISKDTAEWEQRNKPGDRLYRGSQLKEAQAWARHSTPSRNELVFLQASFTNRMRYHAIVAAILLFLVLLVGLVARPLVLSEFADIRFAIAPTIVTSLNDNGPGSLRQAIAVATPGSTITFEASLRGTIVLVDVLDITKSLTIHGPGAQVLSIRGGNNIYRVNVHARASITISGLTFQNSTDGGILNEGTLTLINSVVSHNRSISGAGGGIHNHRGTLTLINSMVSHNTASGLYSSGGGIFNDRGSLMLINSVITNNESSGDIQGADGGGIYNGGTLTLTNSTVSGNTSSGPGGGGQGGGGISNFGSQVDIKFCTIYGNKTSDKGGGLSIEDSQDNNGKTVPGRVRIRNSILAGNHAGTGPNISGALTSDGYNLIQDIAGATINSGSNGKSDIIGSSPDIGPLQNNGGQTKTLALLPGSPAINAIPLQYCQIKDIFNDQSRMYTDQRGMKRPGGNETTCDIGAYEYVEPPT